MLKLFKRIFDTFLRFFVVNAPTIISCFPQGMKLFITQVSCWNICGVCIWESSLSSEAVSVRCVCCVFHCFLSCRGSYLGKGLPRGRVRRIWKRFGSPRLTRWDSLRLIRLPPWGKPNKPAENQPPSQPPSCVRYLRTIGGERYFHKYRYLVIWWCLYSRTLCSFFFFSDLKRKLKIEISEKILRVYLQ